MKTERQYVEDYQITETTNKSGKKIKKAVYTGTYFGYDMELKQFYLWILFQTLAILAMLFLLIAIGYSKALGTRQVYVILPAMLSVFPFLYMVLGMIKLLQSKNRMTRKQTDFGPDRVKRSAVGVMVLAAMAGIGQLIYLLVCLFSKDSKNADIVPELLLLLMLVFLSGCGYLVLRFQKRQWTAQNDVE